VKAWISVVGSLGEVGKLAMIGVRRDSMNIKKQWLPILVSVLVVFFLAITIWQLKYQNPETIESLLAEDLD